LPELSEHEKMVNQIFDYCVSYYGDGNTVSYVFDINGLGSQNRPPMIGNSRPDLYGERLTDGLELIGEAKTKSDLVNSHTEKQFGDYLSYVEHIDAILLVIVAYTQVRRCERLIKSVAKDWKRVCGKVIILPGGSY
jgi:hypothetical protein